MSAKAEIAALQAQLAKVMSKLDAQRARRRILCSCGTRHPINTLDLLVDHWYVEPHGCTGGDYWKEGEFQFVCPTTKVRNRVMFDEWNDVPYEERGRPERQFKSIYRSLFKTVTDTYDDHYSGCNRPWVGCGCPSKAFRNNYYVDNHRRAFELVEKPKLKVG